MNTIYLDCGIPGAAGNDIFVGVDAPDVIGVPDELPD